MTPSLHKTIRITSEAGSLEAIWIPPTNLTLDAAIICHPLPTAGGNMHNKVVHTMAQVFAKKGMGVMRFNTRGTGTSDGEFDNGVGETHDLISVIKHLREQESIQHLWLAGFSFGAFVAFNLLARTHEYHSLVKHLVLAGPPVPRYDFSTSFTITCPITLLQGDADEVVNPASVFTWANEIRLYAPNLELLTFSNCTHFFHGCLIELRERLTCQLELIHPCYFKPNH